ncbi:monovalent cation/H(+) antiporter subunit G [Georgenia satyanarayanai]|uniref:monovalent cation/H(+) antiporter subunit G n=1 Tax=Georgenia satyanarayanai TaxID=860221 RepID=UPI0012653ECF|nr:monovalent cation/H(+) antiporter subunit G [Georgenia satyanarayanai]
MTTDTVLDVVAGTLFIGGALLALVAGLGIVRFPDLLSRMHAATKPQVLGLMLLMTGLGIELRSVTAGITLFLVVAFQLVTGPISAHMLSRAGYRTGKVDHSLLVVDELTEDLERAEKLDELDRLELERERDAALADEGRDARGITDD